METLRDIRRKILSMTESNENNFGIYFSFKGFIISPDDGFQFFSLRKNESLNGLNSSFQLLLFFVTLQGVFLLDQGAVPLNF